MKIVVLDAHTLNPGDLSWEILTALGDCTLHDRTPASQTIARAADAEILLTNKVVLNAETIRALPKLRYIGVLATGYNVVDVAAAHAQGVVVTNVPAYSTPSVAQLVFALLFELTFRTGHLSERVRQGAWATSPDFTFRDHPLIELAGKILGIVGFGRIGATVADIATALNMEVIATTRTRPRATSVPVRWVDLDQIFRQSDVLSLHCPLTPETTNLVTAARLRQMKTSAYLINTSRGPLIDEAALADALQRHHIAGAGLDVLCQEPPLADHPLTRAPNCIITPHVGWGTTAARRRLLNEASENVRAFLSKQPRNVVSG